MLIVDTLRARWLAILDQPGEGEAAIKLYTLYDDYPPGRMGAKRIEQRINKLNATGFEPRQAALLDLGFAPPDERILRLIRPFLDDDDWRFRFAASHSLGRLGDAAAAPALAAMVRNEPARFAAVHAAFALVRLDRLLDSAGRAETRAAIADRRERAVGHDRAALSHLIRSLGAPA